MLIDICAIPEADHQIALLLNTHLGGLGSDVENFDAAIALIAQVQAETATIITAMREHREGRRTLSAKLTTLNRWSLMAAEHAAMTVAQIWDRLHALKSLAPQCPSIADKVDVAVIDEAIERFDAEFPHRKNVRDGYAHKVDKAFSLEKRMQNSVDGAFYSTVLESNALTYTVDGAFARLDVSEASLAHLSTIRDRAFSAFQKVQWL